MCKCPRKKKYLHARASWLSDKTHDFNFVLIKQFLEAEDMKWNVREKYVVMDFSVSM